MQVCSVQLVVVEGNASAPLPVRSSSPDDPFIWIEVGAAWLEWPGHAHRVKGRWLPCIVTSRDRCVPKQGMLDLSRGEIIVADAERLKSVACDCHDVIKANYEQVGR